MFLKDHGAAAILLAIVFMSLGFILGKVTSHHNGHRGCKSATSCSHSDSSCDPVNPHHPTHSAQCKHWDKDGDTQMIIVESMMASGFEGDTILSIPGGSIHISIDGENVDVQVDVEDDVHVDHK